MSKFKDWTGIDFSGWNKISNTVSDWWKWQKIFSAIKRGEFSLNNAIDKANLMAKQTNRTHYVLKSLKGKYIVWNADNLQRAKKLDIVKKGTSIVDVLKTCAYKTKTINCK